MSKGADTEDEVTLAHKHCARNRKEVLASEICGCFYCVTVFPPSQISDWITEPPQPLFRANVLVPELNDDQTAVCPHCGIDSVLGSQSGYPITLAFLTRMHERWF